MTTPRGPGALTAHEARAALVDYLAQCIRDAEHYEQHGEPERAQAYRDVVDDLSALLRRWDIATEQPRPP
ncbi:hypothetical protein ACFWMR_02285 [Amycolatopsis thailandensis]|uniref:hypothetical protein n=1 Tax=Amycolatopsis thailandensis TaxID=589330 RepID=UPI003667A3D7